MDHEVTSAEGHAGELVILVHGLWMPAAVFVLHSRWLQRLGYRTLRFGYHSVRATLSENATELQTCVAETSAQRIHLVGHSLGGLIILDMLARTGDPRLHRAVLLGTPCRDSYAARRLSDVWKLPTLLGQSTMEWLSRGPDTTALQRSMVEVGVLAGTRSVGLGRVLAGLPEPNDGLVTLDEARLPGAIDFIDLPLAHSEMLVSRRCAAQIACFLASGRFMHAARQEERPLLE